jgi:hypothetical protein
MTARPAPDLDAAMVLGMASTAIPFARSREAEAERWLRILRLYGEAGTALQALGVSEAPLEEPVQELAAGGAGGSAPGANGSAPSANGPATSTQDDVLAAVLAGAADGAQRRGATALASVDVLRAVMDFYGSDFDHVLRAHGTDREEVLARLEQQAA